MNTEKIYKKLSLKNKYLDFEVEECENLLEIYQKKFNERVQHIANENNVTLENITKTKNTEQKPKCDVDGDIECNLNKKRFKNSEDMETFKDLYRKIAKKTHPDKTKNDAQSEAMLKKAMKAKDEHDLFTMFDICSDLGIDTPRVTKKHVKLLETVIKEKEEKILNIKKTDAWIWHESPQEIKNNIEQKIIEFLKRS